jgi:6-pyruvoyltetrahydropterin/6-carboxytetrahydropterin synthase
MSSVIITRRAEFDAGHRIPQHGSKCRNAHGHRYVIEATISGVVNDSDAGRSDDGMIVDFGDLKSIMHAEVVDPWDHAFLVYERDDAMRLALDTLGPAHKTVVLSMVPTVENLVQIAAGLISARLTKDQSPFRLEQLRMFETPNCWADWSPYSFD